MNAAIVERRLRRFLLIVVECLCLGTIVELWLAKHVKDPVQLIPFGLCVVGFLSALAVLLQPQRTTIIVLRIVMIVVVLGSVLGAYEHLASNVEFESEMRPSAAATDVVMPALMGSAPLLAPGILALAGILSIAATYYHPALGKSEVVG
jgi:hypothetical protein